MEQPNQRQQEVIFKLQMFEQHMNQVQQQLQAVEQAIEDLNSLNEGIKGLKGKKDTEILAQIGRGIFVKAKLISEELIVDIGNKNLVTKKIGDTNKLISEQMEKLGIAKNELNKNMIHLNSEMENLMGEFQKSMGHSCGDDCECEEDCGDDCTCEKN